MTEQISALIDDELPAEGAVHAIASMQSNRQGAEAWSQYHLIGDAMRGAVTFSPNFKQNLMQKLELEPTILAPNASQAKPTKIIELKSKLPITWSIAASFAAVMLVGWMAMQQQAQPDFGASAFEVAKAESAAGVAVQAIPAEYLVAHHASAPSASSYYVQPVNYAE